MSSAPPSASVVSGQQIGLLGGPIFILYKILGVYHLCEKPKKGFLDKLHPIFWLEGNDADLYEIRAFHGINSKNKIQSYRWIPKHNEQQLGQPIGHYYVDEGLLQLYHEYFTSLPITSHSDDIRNIVFESYRLGDSLFDANQKFFSQIFRSFDNSHIRNNRMIWFRSDDKGFRKFSQDILRKEAKRIKEGQCPVFALIDGKREALFKKNGYCLTRDERKVDLESEIILLPSVWNRSILQDAYLKAAVYVAGPAEEKYLQELLPGYTYYGISPARVIPRMSATVVDPNWIQEIQSIEFSLEEIITHNEGELISQLQAKDPLLKINLKELRKRLKKEKDKAMIKFQEISDQSPKNYEKKLYVEMKHQLGKKRQEFKSRRRKELFRLHSLVNWLHPPIKGKGSLQIPQERFHNLVTFFNFYGIKAIGTVYQKYRFAKKVIDLHE